MSEPTRVWILTDEHINSVQCTSINHTIKRCRAAHHTDIDIRIDGANEYHEADWLKHMVEVPIETAEVAILAAKFIEAKATIARLQAHIKEQEND